VYERYAMTVEPNGNPARLSIELLAGSSTVGHPAAVPAPTTGDQLLVTSPFPRQ
jgi:hypothetical protein